MSVRWLLPRKGRRSKNSGYASEDWICIGWRRRRTQASCSVLAAGFIWVCPAREEFFQGPANLLTRVRFSLFPISGLDVLDQKVDDLQDGNPDWVQRRGPELLRGDPLEELVVIGLVPRTNI